MTVGVIGGGLGGLAAALSLLRAGHDVHVYEQSPRLSEVGAGVQVSPNASRVLHGLGLAGPLAATGVQPLAWHQRRWDDGRTLLRAPIAAPSPHYQMHRADVLAALAAALPADRIHLGHRLIGIDGVGDGPASGAWFSGAGAVDGRGTRPDGVEARFGNGRRVRFDVLVGADGIHSTVRRLLFGPEEARFTGCVAYRAVVPAEKLRHLDLEVTAQIWMGPGRHFVHYFISGRRSVNFVAVVEQDRWTRESWTDQAEIADVLAAFEGWHPQVREIISAAQETYVWALFDRPPMPRWSAGRVTLLGDAAHAMLPFMAQGAAQAIEDGATLAAALPTPSGGHESAALSDASGGYDAAALIGALERYEQVRRPRTSRLQEMSAGNKTRFHLPDGPAQRERDRELAAGSRAWSFNALEWLYDYDAAAVLDR